MDAESQQVEELKKQLDDALTSRREWMEKVTIDRQEIGELKAEIEQLKKLLVEAAEAVQYCHVYRINDATIEYHRELMQRAREVTK